MLPLNLGLTNADVLISRRNKHHASTGTNLLPCKPRLGRELHGEERWLHEVCRGVGRWGPRHILGLLGVLVGAIWIGVLTGYDQRMLWRYPGPQVHSLHPWQGQSQMHVTCKSIQHQMVLIKQEQCSHPAKLVMTDSILHKYTLQS